MGVIQITGGSQPILLADWVNQNLRIAAITGAGISVASGLPLGRTEFKGVSLTKLMTLDFFESDPHTFYQWYRHSITEWSKAKPNRAHLFLSRWNIDVITQNVDHLHHSAGSKRLLKMHGSLHHLVCRRCQQRFTNRLCFEQFLPHCPTCQSLLHPDIVFVGEPVHHFSHAVDWICRAKRLLVIGTRLQMHPCRDLLEIAKRYGLGILEINKEAEEFMFEAERRVNRKV